jgi:hypothetical protein
MSCMGRAAVLWIHPYISLLQLKSSIVPSLLCVYESVRVCFQGGCVTPCAISSACVKHWRLSQLTWPMNGQWGVTACTMWHTSGQSSHVPAQPIISCIRRAFDLRLQCKTLNPDVTIVCDTSQDALSSLMVAEVPARSSSSAHAFNKCTPHILGHQKV